MTITITHSERAARVAAAVKDYIGRDGCESAIEHASKEIDAAARARSAASASVRSLSEDDPTFPAATARYHAACARFEAARAAAAMAEATRNKLRAVTEASAWDDEAATIVQGNPHTPHTPQNAAWAEGYDDAERGHDSLYSRPEFARATFGDCAANYRGGYEAASPGLPVAEHVSAAWEAIGQASAQVETLRSVAQALLGDGFTVAIHPDSDSPAVEIAAGNGALEYVAISETGRYSATQWTEDSLYGPGVDDAEFDTLEEAVEHARVGTTRAG